MSQNRWQDGSGGCLTALRLVFAWLRADELARAGALCTAWRRAAAYPPLWRALLRRRGAATLATPRSTAALLDALALDGADDARTLWRDEYVAASAGWHLESSLRPSGGARLVHAALCGRSLRIALLTDDASLSVWEPAWEVTTGEGAGGEGHEWRECWGTSLAHRSWRAGVRGEWAAGGARLLLAGSLTLTGRWELLVLHFDDAGRGTEVSRAGCSAGAAGCWTEATGDAFLSLEQRALAPRLATTTIWLNSATQVPRMTGTESDYAGVTAPLLRIFHEDGEHITHVLVAAVPLVVPPAEDPKPGEIDDVDCTYYRVALAGRGGEALQNFVCAWGAPGGGGALGAWALGALLPVPLCKRNDLSTIRNLLSPCRRGVRPAPDAAAVRALCTTPDYECRLPTPVVGLVAHRSGGCVWASTSDRRAVCLSLPTLRRLRELVPDDVTAIPAPMTTDYMQPDLSDEFVVRPVGAGSERVLVWRALSGARCRPPDAVPPSPRSPSSPAPALGSLLPPRASPPALLVLTGDALHVWRSRATRATRQHQVYL